MEMGPPILDVPRANNEMSNSLNLPAVLLVGGMGTRLRSVVSSAPKPLAMVGSRSFLELLILQLRSQGVTRIVMCTGYLADQIETQFGNGGDWGIAIEYSRESSPLGTGGAVKLAEQHVKDASDFLVMNGDSFLEIDLGQLLRFHHGHGGLVSMAVVGVPNAGRYGTVQLEADGRVTGFAEKAGREEAGLINAGVYVFKQAVLQYVPERASSLERDVFPKLLSKSVYALVQHGMFIDIGTPEEYGRAQQLGERLYQLSSSRPDTSR